MLRINSRLAIPFLLSIALGFSQTQVQHPKLSVLGTYRTGSYNQGAAEIVAHDPATQRLFVVNGGDRTIDVLDMKNPADMRRITRLTFTPEQGRAANSVAVKNGVVAVLSRPIRRRTLVPVYSSIPREDCLGR